MESRDRTTKVEKRGKRLSLRFSTIGGKEERTKEKVSKQVPDETSSSRARAQEHVILAVLLLLSQLSALPIILSPQFQIPHLSSPLNTTADKMIRTRRMHTKRARFSYSRIAPAQHPALHKNMALRHRVISRPDCAIKRALNLYPKARGPGILECVG